jgi:hypothetical protein
MAAAYPDVYTFLELADLARDRILPVPGEAMGQADSFLRACRHLRWLENSIETERTNGERKAGN